MMVALDKIGNATRTLAQVYNLVDKFTTLSGIFFLMLNIGNIVKLSKIRNKVIGYVLFEYYT